MRRNRSRFIWNLLVVCSLAATQAIALPQSDKIKVKGMIVDRTGDSLDVKTPEGVRTVLLDDATKVQDVVGIGLRKKQYTFSVLIPGLKISVDGTSDSQSRIVAKSITFDGDDLETAQMIQAGLHPTVERVAANERAIGANKQGISSNEKNISANKQAIEANEAANTQAHQANAERIAANKRAAEQAIREIEEANQRFSNLNHYDVKSRLTVRFATGSSALTEADKLSLLNLAREAAGIAGYIIEVKGFADSSGSKALNQKLSEDRADAVVEYLIQRGSIPVRHIVVPGAMGISHPVASNDTATGRAENRRVEVSILVNRAVK